MRKRATDSPTEENDSSHNGSTRSGSPTSSDKGDDTSRNDPNPNFSGSEYQGRRDVESQNRGKSPGSSTDESSKSKSKQS
jgi:hypothetical protein